jgi:L-lactate dehydrogenase (cytochrome)
MRYIADVEEMRRIARQRVPRMFYDYVDSGSWTEGTYRANEDAFRRIGLRQRVAVDLSTRSLASEMIGQTVSMPVALAPTGLTGMVHPDGEIIAAKVCEALGIPFTLSTMSICSIEDIAERVSKPFWFQLYVMRDRDFVHRLIDRAKAAQCSALVLTLDLQILGIRHRDVKNGLSVPPRPTIPNLLNVLSKPGWLMGMASTPRRTFRNIAGHVEGVTDMSKLSVWTAEQFDASLSWDDVNWIRDRWGGKLILKGILDPADAERAAKTGADALVVSNHGGRQLDGAPATIDALPDVVAAVGNRMEVHLDSGIRSGQDVLKALALGAKGTYIGRAYLYGLGAYGEAGLRRVLEMIRTELDLSMAFCGRRSIAEIDRSILLETRR